MASSRSSRRPERTPAPSADTQVLGAVGAALRRLDADDRVVVAFSGGVDSAVLLDALARSWPRERIHAWHVHHGLQPQADEWLAHCAREAGRLGVHFGATRVDAPVARGINIEGWARDARYRALWAAVAASRASALLTAHQADDQLETVLMRLSRGSGVGALAGMLPAQRRAGGWLLRPLLAVPRERVVAYARARGLAWIDDPMNDDPGYLRVALRTRVIPEWTKAVPALRENVLRSAQWLREGGRALRDLAERDLREAGLEDGARALDRRALAALSAVRRDQAVRAWFGALGATMPPRKRLAEWVEQMLVADSAHAEFVHERWRFRRYRDRIEVDAAASRDAAALPVPFTFRWHGEPEIALPGWGGHLRFSPSARADSLDAEWLAAQPLALRAARGVDRLRPRAGGPSRTLKNLFQERGIPPRLRATMPALQGGGRVLYVAGIGMDRSGAPVPPNGQGIDLSWRVDAADDPRAAFPDPGPPV